MMWKKWVISFLALFAFVDAKEARPYCILTNREGAGLFSMYSDVLALVDSYDQGLFQGIEVDFGEAGLYWEKNYGPNWWNYYCEPISLGEKKDVCKGEYSLLTNIVSRYYYKSREDAYLLIQKYFKFRPDVLQEVEEFASTYFGGEYVIGIHYRGTDAPDRLAYEIYTVEVQEIIDKLNSENYKVFVATDDEYFIEFLLQKFPEKICFQNAILRSLDNQPLHFDRDYDHYLHGKEALVDCLLLSKCSCLLLSFSNLSLWAAILNPYIPAKDLSKSLPMLNK